MGTHHHTAAIAQSPALHYFLDLVLDFFLPALNIRVTRAVESAGVALVDQVGEQERRAVFFTRACHIRSEGPYLLSIPLVK